MLVRQHAGLKNEMGALITSLTPEQLNVSQWLQANRQAWGIGNGLHQRLDVSLNDDHCRVRCPSGLWILGVFRHLTNSSPVEWLSRQCEPQHKSTTDFQTFIVEDNLSRAVRFVTSKRPSF